MTCGRTGSAGVIIGLAAPHEEQHRRQTHEPLPIHGIAPENAEARRFPSAQNRPLTGVGW
jgi:hypothetical protein